MNSFTRPASFHCIVIFILLSLFSCSSSPEEPVTVQDAKDFARQIQSSIEKRQPEFYNNAFDKKTFLKKAGLPKERDARAFSSALSDKLKMGTQLINSISEKGTYQLVKHYEKDNKQHLLFRLYDDGSLNYHDIELTKAGKETKIADMYIYTSGELFSETMRKIYQEMKGVMDKSSSADEGWIRDLPRMRALINQRKHEEALEIYERLPADIKKMKAVQIIHITIGAGLDDEGKYEAILDEYTSLYPNEPNMHLITLDGHIIKKQYDKALYSINEMDRMINKDPFLDYYRYLIYNLKQKDDSAKMSIERLMTNLPDFEDGMIELIAVYIEEKNKPEADKWIKEYRLHSSFDQSRLETLLLVNDYE